jgi:hypothetical protein
MFVTRLSISLTVALADLPTPDPAPDAAREKAKEILSDSQFDSGSSKSVMQRIVDWILDQIRLPFSEAAGGNNVVGFVILIAFLVALGYVVSRIRLRMPALSQSDDAIIDIDVEADRSAETWRAEAEQAEAAGQWKIALRARYRWLLGELIERQLLVNVPGRTPGEYRGDLARVLPDQASAFASATDLFELAWYGNEATGPEENQRFRTCAEQVIAAADRVLV